MMKSRWLCLGFLLIATAARADGAAAPEQVERGRYLALAGDCVACHTATGGAAFTGGLAMETPIGRIYSTNITPDPQTGIGAYTEGDFARAVRKGIARDGRHLYPAMPYPSFARITDADIGALYAYFRSGVAPVRQANQPSAIPALLSFRWPLALWNAVFVRQSAFVADPAHDAVWNRGAYLVQGLGHCGTCHSPRGLAFQEKAASEKDGTEFLAGADINGWYAKSLRGDPDGLGRWSETELVTFLRTGRTDRTAAFADMAEVVQHSTQFLTDDDLTAVARYLKSLPATRGIEAASADHATVPPSGEHPGAGGATYGEFCVTCHRGDGAGVKRIFPALAGNSVVATADATSLIRIVLSGGRMPHTEPRRAAFAMPHFDMLDDGEVAQVVSFIRSAWGNSASPVTPGQVARVRAALQEAAANP